MKKRYLSLLLLGVSLSLTSCGPVTQLIIPALISENNENHSDYDVHEDYDDFDMDDDYDDEEYDTSTDSFLDEFADTSDLQNCTVDNISFSVSSSLEPLSGNEGTFTSEDKSTIYQLQGTSSLGSATPEDAFQKLSDFYSGKYSVTHCDSELTPITTQDNVDCSVGRVEMIDDGVFYCIDVLICPQKNKVITYASQCLEGNTPSINIRNITATTTFQIGAEDYVSGNTFVGSDDSELCLNSDGSFIYYQYSTDHEGPYYSGTYDVYYGQDAIDKIVSMEEYGLTEEELNQTLSANMNGYKPGGSSITDYVNAFSDDAQDDSEDLYHVCKDTFYAIILHNDELVEPENQVTTLGHDTLYLGYYIPELEIVDLTNANTANHTEWRLTGKTE